MGSGNRYAWTNAGPVTVMNGGYYNTAYVRRWLSKEHGLEIERWARNWAAFLGWQERPIFMPNPFSYPEAK